MTIPGAPLPTLTSLLQALRAPEFTGEPWFNGRPEYCTRVFWQGRLALAAGIEAVRRARAAEVVNL